MSLCPVRLSDYDPGMKTCKNCRCVWPDEYNGTCLDCGAPMNGIQVNGSNDYSRRFARQIQQGQRENESEREMKRGRFDNVPLDQGVVAIAKQFAARPEWQRQQDKETQDA